MTDRAAQVRRRGAVIYALCLEIEEAPTERTFKIVECGLHSGFPCCCIVFYATMYSSCVYIIDQMCPHGETHDQLLARATPAQAIALRTLARLQKQRGWEDPTQSRGYIACAECLLVRNYVRVRSCDWHFTARERRRILASGSSVVS